jgi:hypothetical protein
MARRYGVHNQRALKASACTVNHNAHKSAWSMEHGAWSIALRQGLIELDVTVLVLNIGKAEYAPCLGRETLPCVHKDLEGREISWDMDPRARQTLPAQILSILLVYAHAEWHINNLLDPDLVLMFLHGDGESAGKAAGNAACKKHKCRSLVHSRVCLAYRK